jgi:predicted ATPase/class 3 adenylate cyclase
MRKLPTGTVAFLMTDIEGSTRLIERLGDKFPSLLDDHLALLDRAIGGNGGTLVSTEGDSVFAVFPSVREAINAAVAAQRALAGHTWPDGVKLGVRIGVHVGEAVLGGRDYTGIDVHRTARVMAAGHGGQVLVTQAARDLAGGTAPHEVAFLDLGSHSLRDLPDREHLYQILAPALATDFPPPRTQASAEQAGLPTFLTRFIGRRRELVDVGDLLARERMVTLTGAGGTGKTRLAIETARSLADRYPDGSWFVALDVVRDPALVLAAIAATLGVPEQPGRPIGAVLGEYLAPRHALVLLDNLEQVIEAAPEIGSLFGSAPGLAVLATSREPLSIAGEHVYQVQPLDLPAEPGVPTARDIAANEAVELFVGRARSARSDFTLNDANAPAIAAICRRLDGLPLAIELAAARINLLSPDQIVARLDHRLTLLASSRRDLPDRQRTLRAAIDWSHDLLAEPEQAFFRRFSAFSGGAELEAIRAVVDPEAALGDALDLASALVDRSLLRSTRIGDENRLDMLETIREYAAEHLAASPQEESETRARHAAHYRDLAESSEGLLTNVRRDEILDRLDRELANFRAAIAWSLEARLPDTGLRIAAALREFWHVRNRIHEGRLALDELLAASASDGATTPRFRALTIGGGLASWHGDYGRSLELFEEAVAMAEATGHPRQVAAAKSGMGWAMIGSRPSVARDRLEDAIALARELGDSQILFVALQGLTLACFRLGDLGAARRSALEVSALGEAAGERYSSSLNLAMLGMIAAREGDPKSGGRHMAEALRQLGSAGGHIGLSIALDSLATLVFEQGEPERGAILAAAADRLRREVGGGPSGALLGLEEPLDRARRTMAPSDFERAVAAGRALTTDEAVALGLEIAESGSPEPTF